MSFKLLASIRFLELQDLEFIETPVYKITTLDAEKSKILGSSFSKYAGMRDLNSYDKNALAYAVNESVDDNEAFQQSMREALPQLAKQIETFLLFLWFVKDNSISLEQVYGEFTIAKAIFWWTGRNVLSTSNGQFISTTFSKAELNEVVELLLKYTQLCLDIEQESPLAKTVTKQPIQSGEFLPGIDPNKIENRIERAMSFLSSARSTPHLPQKISHYMAILECLFSSDGNEIIHKVSERTAFYLEENTEDRIKIFNGIKSAYNIRSKFVHGDKPPKTHEQLSAIATEVDDIIRRVLKKVIINDFKTFLQKDLTEYFNKLIF